MDALDRGPEDDDVSGMPYDRPGSDRAPAGDAVPEAGQPAPAGGAVRVASVVAGDYLLTVNPVDGSEVVMCPPERRPVPERRTPEERAARRRAARPVTPGPAARVEHPLLERAEESERLVRLLGRGRSVRVTGPSGVGRSALLATIADRCAGLAPDGVVHLSGYRRTPADLLYDLYATVYRTEGHRPDRARLLESVSGIGAIVVLDDLEFGGAPLEELLEAACECAFLIAATPDVAAPAPDSPIEEVFLRGLSKEGCLELVERSAGRPLSEEETAWVSDLWFESEGLPLRFVQAGALLRLRDAPWDGDADPDYADDADEDDDTPFGSPGDVPLPPLAAGVAESLAMRLSTQAREALRVALALGGECVHPSHLPALLGDTGADAALGELIASGLATTVGSHYRLAAGALRQLTGEVRRAAEHAKAVAQHYAWWAAHPSITAERVGQEADALFAAMTATRDHGQPSTAVLLARSAAPAFAAALNWGAWERALRIGQEAARQAGEVAEEAYFHHELGVLALCSGNLERARTELEASIGMRGVLADRQGTVVGRRTLALVTDRARGLAPGGAPGADVVPTGRTGASAGPRIPEIPAERTAVAGITAVAPSFVSDTAPTVVTRRLEERPPARGRGQTLTGSRRNLAAATAGALLVAVLGTVVTLGVTSGDGTPHTAPSSADPGQSAAQDNGTGGLPAEQPTSGVAATSRPTPAASGVHGVPGPAASGVAGVGGSPTGGLIPSPVTKPTNPPSPRPSSSGPSASSSSPASTSPSATGGSSAPASNPSGASASASTSGTPVATTSGSAAPSQSGSAGSTQSGTPSASGGTVL